MTEKCILLPLHPKWWPQILSGYKTLEIRKTPLTCFSYYKLIGVQKGTAGSST